MNFLKAHGFKFFIILYTIIFIGYGIFSAIISGEFNNSMSNIEFVVNTLLSLIILFGFGLCYSVAFKKKFFTNKAFTCGSVLFFIMFLINFIYYAYSEISNDSFPKDYYVLSLIIFLVIYSSLMLIVFSPFFISFFMYLFKSKDYQVIEKPIHKLIVSFLTLGFVTGVIRLSFICGNISVFNIFDFIEIFGAIILYIMCLAYAFNIKNNNRRLITTFVICAMISQMFPLQLHSLFYIDNMSLTLTNSSVAEIIYSIAVLFYVVYLNFRYAFNIYNKDKVINE